MKEAKKGEVAYPNSHRKSVTNPAHTPGILIPQVQYLSTPPYYWIHLISTTFLILLWISCSPLFLYSKYWPNIVRKSSYRELRKDGAGSLSTVCLLTGLQMFKVFIIRDSSFAVSVCPGALWEVRRHLPRTVFLPSKSKLQTISCKSYKIICSSKTRS